MPLRPGPTALLDALTGSDPTKRDSSLRYIKKNIPADLLPRLCKFILKNGNAEQKDVALEVMKLYPSHASVPYWTEILEKTESIETKILIIQHISRFNDRRMVLPLTQELKSPFLSVREEAAKALRRADDRIYPVVLDMAESPNPVLRIYAIEAFFYMYDRRFYGIVVNFLNDPNKSVRVFALRCIAENKLSNAIKKIRHMALSDDNDEVRIEAIRTIGSLGDAKSLYVLYNTLDHENPAIRYESVKSIELIPYTKSSYPLSKRLKIETDYSIKKSIIAVLTAFRHAGYITGLAEVLLKDENPELRIDAAMAIGWIKDRKGTPYLVKALEDKDFRVRAESSASLGNYRSKSVINNLLELVEHDKSRYVRSAALFAVKKINDRKSILNLYDQYTVEKDPVFKEQLRGVIRSLLQRYL